MKRKKLIFSFLLLAVVGVALAFVLSSDKILFEYPERGKRYLLYRMADRLSSRHDLVFYMSFDESQPIESVGVVGVDCPVTKSVRGRFGRARKINGKSNSYVATRTFWDQVKAPDYTLSLWVKVKECRPDQEIWYTQSGANSIGLKLEAGRMTFYIPGPTHVQTLSYPFDSFKEFVHIAGVVDATSGLAKLYENGQLRAETSVEEGTLPHRYLEFGKAQWNCFRGSIDETSVWRRALSQREVRKLARARRPLLQRLEPFDFFALGCVRAYRSVVPTILASFHKLNPMYNTYLPVKTGLPKISLHFSKNDLRHFVRAHEESLLSGQRTRRAASYRKVIAQIDGKAMHAEVCLDDTYASEATIRRPAYVIRSLPDAGADSIESLRIYPPEAYTFFHPDSLFPVPLDVNNFARFAIDGTAKGVYCVERVDRMGSAWLLDDWRKLQNRGFPLRNSWAGPLSETWKLTPEEVQTNRDKIQHLLSCDFLNPWSPREWSWQIRRQAQLFKENGFIEHGMTAFDVLGDNPSPFYVLSDLDLTSVGSDIVWTSSHTNLITSTGQVQRPQGDLPLDVVMKATKQDGTAEDFRFRVIPDHPRLPALMLHINAPLVKISRQDFSAVFYPSCSNSSPRRLTGLQETRGGIKHRGNTSYVTAPKKPMSLHFDEPHHLFTDTDTKHLYLLSGYAEDTRMRNKFSYDTFRSFASSGHPRYAPEISWTEVFVNGEYYGVFETCTRIHGSALGVPDTPPDPHHTPLLYKIRRLIPLFANTDVDIFQAIMPRANKLSRRDAILGLMTFTSGADPETFRRDIAKHIDLDNLVDFTLLLNFTGNEDGRITNFYFARGAEEDSPFFLIPWDYDKTFRERFLFLSNHLIDRMKRDVPGFNETLSRRWAELRATVLTEHAVDARFTEMENVLTGYMDWEHELLKRPTEKPSYETAVDDFRRIVKLRLEKMDVLFKSKQ